jgi:catechol 2,3-dioxygenase-like lactoylglutathione lyase family enzyme
MLQLTLSRVILFTANMDGMVAFYRDVLGFKVKTNDEGWKTFDAGSCEIALHRGGTKPGPRSPKIQFDVKDVAATRDWLSARGAKLGKVSSKDGLDLCNGKDPDGNTFSLSNRS